MAAFVFIVSAARPFFARSTLTNCSTWFAIDVFAGATVAVVEPLETGLEVDGLGVLGVLEVLGLLEEPCVVEDAGLQEFDLHAAVTQEAELQGVFAYKELLQK